MICFFWLLTLNRKFNREKQINNKLTVGALVLIIARIKIPCPLLCRSRERISGYLCKRRAGAPSRIRCPKTPVQSAFSCRPMLVSVVRQNRLGTNLCRPGKMFVNFWKHLKGFLKNPHFFVASAQEHIVDNLSPSSRSEPSLASFIWYHFYVYFL